MNKSTFRFVFGVVGIQLQSYKKSSAEQKKRVSFFLPRCSNFATFVAKLQIFGANSKFCRGNIADDTRRLAKLPPNGVALCLTADLDLRNKRRH